MGSSSKSMHREVQIKHDLMTHIDGLRQETSGLCEKTNSIYIVFTSCNHSHVHYTLRERDRFCLCMRQKSQEVISRVCTSLIVYTEISEVLPFTVKITCISKYV